MSRPNILFLMTDQQRYDSMGCYGVDFAHTPNLDRLAEGGALFERCYVNNPICTPSRACMMTGKHLPGHGVYQLYDNLPKNEVMFTEHLQDFGYKTALFGKLHVSSAHEEAETRHPHDGFDVYEPCREGCMHMESTHQAYARWLEANHPEFYSELLEKGRGLLHPPQEVHLSHWAAERTIAYLQEHADEEDAQPFFCKMSIFEPHNPYEHYPKELSALVNPDAIPAPQHARTGDPDEPKDINRERARNHLRDIADLDAEGIRHMRHGYHASVAYSDLEFGRVLYTLEELGLADNTLVIFTSDHGDMLGDHDLLVKGAFFYEANVRVPLLMRWPERFSGGHRVSGLVQLHDLAATVLDAGGMAAEDIATVMPDAESLLPLVGGDLESVHEEAVCCYRNSGIMRGGTYWDPAIDATMLFDGRYKLNLWHDPLDTSAETEGELFDLESDPREETNLWSAPDVQEVKARLTERLLAWVSAREQRPGSWGGETLVKTT
jgi:arylsulfatase A-like enzyme